VTVADGAALSGSAGEPDGDLGVVVTTHEPDSAVVLTVTGEVDLLTARRLRESIQRALDGQPPTLVVDLTNVPFFGSSGLGVLVEFRSAALERTAIRVVAADPALRPLQLTGLTSLFAVYPTLEDALGTS
jgi:anti-sigma B factor antagonist